MGDRIVELRWTCGECDTSGILGRHKECPQCGASREQGEMEMDLGDRDADGTHPAASVTDASLLELAHAGADWFCAHCESGNRGDATVCVQCGARRDGDDLSEPSTPPPAPAVPAVTRPSRALGFPSAAGALVAVTLLVAIVGWMMGTSEVQGEVIELSWTHRTFRQSWTPVVREGFRSTIHEHRAQMPSGGQGGVAGAEIIAGTCREKHHHDETYPCGTERVCTPRTRTETYACGETCETLDNGFARCKPKTCTRQVPDGETCADQPKTCTRSVTQPWCRYRTHAWQTVETAVAEGTGGETVWRELEPGPHDRILRDATYRALVDYQAGKRRERHTLELSGESWRSWAVGMPVTVEVDRLGNVSSVKPPGG